MRTFTIALTFVAVAALAVAGTQTSLAGAGDRSNLVNSAGIANAGPAQIAPLHKATPNSPEFHRIRIPSTDYTEHSCMTDLSAIEDFTLLDQIDSNCDVIISLGGSVEKRSVPDSWLTWESPPKSEGDTPHVLYSALATTLTLSYDAPQTIGGFEVEPEHFQRESIEADFYTGPNGTGDHVGTIIRNHPNGNYGARLFAVQSTTPWQSIVVTDLAGNDFAIARLRTSP